MKKFWIISLALVLTGIATAFIPENEDRSHLLLTFENAEGKQMKKDLDLTTVEDFKQKIVKTEFFKKGLIVNEELTCILVYSPMRGDAELISGKDQSSIIQFFERYQNILKPGDRIIIDNIQNKDGSVRVSPIVKSFKK
ncbi:MAG: hypothetical protein GC180_04205 [Bacteroidetes bacterium]|nr:hypothetical protein [Bacteroidota bacterium]